MAQVPTDPIGNVVSRPIAPGYQTTQADPVAFGSLTAEGLGKGAAALGQASDALEQIAQQRQDILNTTALKQADVLMRTQMMNIGYGTPADPTTGQGGTQGYYSNHGQAAVDAAPATIAAMQKAQKDISDGITNPLVQRQFNLMAAEQVRTEQQKVQAHATASSYEALNQASVARMTVAINQAASAALTDPSKTDDANKIISSEVPLMLARQGVKDQSVVDAQVQVERSKLFTTVADAMKYQVPVETMQAFTDKYASELGAASGRIMTDVHRNATFNAAQEREARMEAKQAQIEAQQRQMDSYVRTYIANGEDPTKPQVDLGAVGRDSMLTDTAKLELKRLVDAANRPEPPTSVSNRTMTSLFNNLSLPADDPNRTTMKQINDAMGSGTLTTAHYGFLVKTYDQNKTDEGQRMTDQLTHFINDNLPGITKAPLGGLYDTDAGQRANAFRRMVMDQATAAHAKGESYLPLITPNNPKYINPELFQGNMQLTLQSMQRYISGDNKPPSAAETAAAEAANTAPRVDQTPAAPAFPAGTFKGKSAAEIQANPKALEVINRIRKSQKSAAEGDAAIKHELGMEE